jgi:hypothetical protein
MKIPEYLKERIKGSILALITVGGIYVGVWTLKTIKPLEDYELKKYELIEMIVGTDVFRKIRIDGFLYSNKFRSSPLEKPVVGTVNLNYDSIIDPEEYFIFLKKCGKDMRDYNMSLRVMHELKKEDLHKLEEILNLTK